jgi:DNA replication protein DnaC
MNNQQTIEMMKSMKFYGMIRAFQTSMEAGWTGSPSDAQLQPDQLIAQLIQAEWEDREQRKIKRYLNAARFRYQASIAEIDFNHPRNLDKNLILRLADCSFLDKKENILITGLTGVGKSFIASAIGNQACMKGYRTFYFNVGKLFSQLKMSKADNSYAHKINRIAKQDLLILDDFGLHSLDNANRLALMEIIEDRHGKMATIITSQLPVNKWYETIGESTIADAILDRLVHSAHRIELKGESMRKKRKK